MSEQDPAPDQNDARSGDLSIGTRVADRYMVQQVLGRGATGTVYRAEDPHQARQVALKVLHPHLRSDAGVVRRFLREFHNTASLDHPCVVRTFEAGQQDGTDRLVFIAMELLSGRTLAQTIKSEFPLPWARTLRLMRQILAAMSAAHAAGIIHRDLKPANVLFVDATGDQIKVGDFGLAKLSEDAQRGQAGERTVLTLQGELCGTPEYMSPEQARGEPLDGRADLYAFGILVYQLLTGDVPFRAGSSIGVVSRQLSDAPEPPSRRLPALSIAPPLEALLLRTLAKQRDDRPASVVAFREELDRILAAHPEPVKHREGTRAAAASTRPTDAATISGRAVSSAPSTRGRRVPPWTLAAGGLALLSGAAYVGLRDRAPVTPPSAATAMVPSAVSFPRAAPVTPPVTPTPVTVAPASPPPAAAPPAPAAAVGSPPKKRRATPRAAAEPSRVTAAPPAVDPLTRAEAAFDSDPDAACSVASELRGRSDLPARGYLLLGRCDMRMNQAPRGLEMYRRFLELAPNAKEAAWVRPIVKSAEKRASKLVP